MKVSNNFVIQEFVPKETYDLRFPSVWFIDERVIKIAQFMRDRFKCAMFINSWHLQPRNSLSYRGFRPFSGAGAKVGSKYSQHRWGRAFDHHCVGISVQEVYADIMNNIDLYHDQGVRAVENIDKTPTWIHIDIRNYIPLKKEASKILIV